MTHLEPAYRPNYGRNDCAFIQLEGEFEFRADLTGNEVYELLSDRAEVIGGLCTLGGENEVEVHPWNGPGHFVLHFPSADEPVERIDVKDRDGEVVEQHPIDELKQEGEMAEKMANAIAENMTPANDSDEPEEGETYRIDFGEGELVPTEDEDE